ncbi:MAG TPA: hypothetical protein VFQ19_18380 [Nocardioidaceae bacterium]|nr:hypothetical protein [Nocardioidaceae bacterium]
MGDDQRPDAPSLEAPSLGKLFGRRKGRTPAADPSPEQPAAPGEPREPAPGGHGGPASGDTDAPVDWAPVEAEPTQQLDDPAPTAPAAPASSPTHETASSSAGEDTTVLPPTPAAPPAAAAPVVPPAAARTAPPTTAPTPAPVPATASAPLPADPAPAEPARAPRATLTVDARVAAAVTGLVVGLLVVVLTAGSLALCESVRGVSSCGGGPGFLLLVLVMASMVVLGGLMLRLARVPDPTSTSFLAVGLLAVLSLLFLVDVLEEWWMIIVIPLLSVAMFLLSHWVTTQVVDTDS